MSRRRRAAIAPPRARTAAPPTATIGVVVPAHEEAASIGLCLRSIRRAARHPALADVRITVVVVLDHCSDETGAEVERVVGLRLSTLVVSHRNVGQARRAGFGAVLDRASALDRAWLTTTDADTVVPGDWLARQLAWRHRGAHAVAGTVRVTDWGDRDAAAQARFADHQATLGTGHGHGHVHGANLAFRADAYVGVGGMPAIGLAEDHALWTRFAADGRPTRAVGDMPVHTSTRRDGRAPGGFSTFLDHLEDQGPTAVHGSLRAPLGPRRSPLTGAVGDNSG